MRVLLERLEALDESEVWVDVNGYAHDDEGNVWRVGTQHSGHHGKSGSLGGGSRRPRSTFRGSKPSQDMAKIAALAKALERRHNNFLSSVSQQLTRGRTLSEKQKKIVREILHKLRMKDEAELFR